MPDDSTKNQSDTDLKPSEKTGSGEKTSEPQPSFSPQTPPPTSPSLEPTVSSPSTQNYSTQTTDTAQITTGGTNPNTNSSTVSDEPNTVVTSEHVPKKYGGKKIIATIFGVLLLIVGVAAGVFLVQQEQEIRERAASGRECQQSPDCILLDEPGNSGSFEAPRDILYVEIAAQDFHRYDTTTNDGCYDIRIEDRFVSWNRIGSGSDCRDVSNVQIHLTEEKIVDQVNCPISPTEDRYVVILNESSENQLYSDRGEQGANFGPIDVNIPVGNYRVTLVTFDDHHLKPNQTQPREQWYLTTDSSGNTGTISDLPNNQDWLIEIVNQAFPIDSPITSVTARHAAYPDNSNPNSLSPVCAAFESIEEVPTPTEIPTPSPTPSPPPGISAQCNDVKVYDAEWNLLSSSQLSALSEGDTIRFAVSGTASAGTFDRARFTLNSLSLGETATLKPGSEEFYIEYTVPGDVTSFAVTAQVHHSELGWF